jgi:molybdenum cofactor cytidylyltransferase
MPDSVTVILLAAGLSKRMGRPKQLLPIDGKELIRHVLDVIFEAGIKECVVVLGPESEKIQRAIQGLPLTLVFNRRRDSEMAESVRVGLRAVSDACSGVLIALCDHPLITAETYRILIGRHGRHPGQILIPTYEQRRGHPSLFPLPVLKEVFSGVNLRDLIHQHSDRVKLVPVADPGVILDLDTDQDYQKLRGRLESPPDSSR